MYHILYGTFWGLSENLPMIFFYWTFQLHFTNFLRCLRNFRTYWGLSEDFLRTLSGLSGISDNYNNFLRTVIIFTIFLHQLGTDYFAFFNPFEFQKLSVKSNIRHKDFRPLSSSVRLRGPPLDSEMSSTRELC